METAHPLLPKRNTNPPKKGRPQVEDRVAMTAIFYRYKREFKLESYTAFLQIAFAIILECTALGHALNLFSADSDSSRDSDLQNNSKKALPPDNKLLPE